MQKRMELRKQMKAKEIDPKQYQKLWTPFRKEKQNMEYDLQRFEFDTLRELFPEERIEFSEVRNYVRECEENKE